MTLSLRPDPRPAFIQMKKKLSIHTCVDLSGFEEGGSCGIRTYDPLVTASPAVHCDAIGRADVVAYRGNILLSMLSRT